MSVLALRRESCCSSSRLAETVNTNPVVIRRLLIDLQKAGLIETHRGPHGGAYVVRKPDSISLLEIHRAVDPPVLFGVHPNRPSRDCPVGKRIERVMVKIIDRTNSALEAELKQMTLADVLRDLGR
jgi:Rrf2 family protein